MNPYAPTCPACRISDMATFYKACQGCQARRAKAMQAFHAAPGGALPVPSVDGPARCTCGVATASNTPAVRKGYELGGYAIPDPECPVHRAWRPKDGPGWRTRGH